GKLSLRDVLVYTKLLMEQACQNVNDIKQLLLKKDPNINLLLSNKILDLEKKQRESKLDEMKKDATMVLKSWENFTIFSKMFSTLQQQKVQNLQIIDAKCITLEDLKKKLEPHLAKSPPPTPSYFWTKIYFSAKNMYEHSSIFTRRWYNNNCIGFAWRFGFIA
ncbi:hypothetical protein ACFL4A_04380, partial [bacterium]